MFDTLASLQASAHPLIVMANAVRTILRHVPDVLCLHVVQKRASTYLHHLLTPVVLIVHFDMLKSSTTKNLSTATFEKFQGSWLNI